MRRVELIADCPGALAECGVELRLTVSLWPYIDAVVEAGGEFSVIRSRNAHSRDHE